MPDVAGVLNDAERRVLMLLAEGLTAKTAAAAIGSTEGAVNERLREARRKTGVGSSRELARMLAAQENRDEQIGVVPATPAADAAATDLPHRVAGRLRKVVLVMSLLIVLGVAAALLGGHQDGRADPLLGDLLTAKDTPRDLYAAVRAEPRDAAWAPGAEAALLNRFGGVPGIAKLRVTCGSTLCEVAGVLLPGDRAGDALLALQDITLNGVRTIGFATSASFSVGGKVEGQGAAFAAYPRRATTASVPAVVRTIPAEGAIVAAGPLAVSVTFDRPMRRDSYSFTSVDGASSPDCNPVPEVSADARTFTLRCTAVAGTAYALGINHGRFRNFVAAADGTPAGDHVVRFTAR